MMGKVVGAGLLALTAVMTACFALHATSSVAGQASAPVILAPADGATVAGPVTVRIQYAGAIAGHIHLLIDADPPAPGEVVPVDERHLHLINLETQTTIDLAPGEHRLQLLLGTPDHRVPNPPVLSKSVRITVLPKE